MNEGQLSSNSIIYLLSTYDILKKSVKYYESNKLNIPLQENLNKLYFDCGINISYCDAMQKTIQLIDSIDRGLQYADTINPLSSEILKQKYVVNKSNMSIARQKLLCESAIYYNQKKCLVYATRGSNVVMCQSFTLQDTKPSVFYNLQLLSRYPQIVDTISPLYLSCFTPSRYKTAKNKLQKISDRSTAMSEYKQYYMPLAILLFGYNAYRSNGIYINPLN